MILPIILALLAAAVLLSIIAPLLRGNWSSSPAGGFDQAVYRDQLQELDRDIGRGLITATEVNATRLEIQRRLLAADKPAAKAARSSPSPILAAFVFAIAAIGTVCTYWQLGAPGIAAQSSTASQPDAAQDATQLALQQEAVALSEKLKRNPADAPVWLLYAQTLATLSQWDEAEDAYRHAMDLGQTDPDVAIAHAEMIVMQAGGTVTPPAEAAFRKILQADPDSGIARYYLALAAKQAGKSREAIDGFQALLSELPADSPLRDQLGQLVAEAARDAGIPVPELAKAAVPAQPGPDAVAVADAANMTEDQRQAMIRGMVAKLAARQEAEPANLDDWLRLGQAYTVLREPEKAADAYEKAARLKPDDVSIPLQEVRALLSGHAPTDKLSPRVKSLLRQIEAAAPDQPPVLWYLGLAAAQDARADDARRYWGTLLAKLPADDNQAKAVRSAIENLPVQ